VASILALPEVRDALLKQGMVPVSGSPDEAARAIAADVERWKKFVAQTGIRAD
jgi:tripartite-type tricarboxylate transporter receptor subunit TctC